MSWAHTVSKTGTGTENKSSIPVAKGIQHKVRVDPPPNPICIPRDKNTPRGRDDSSVQAGRQGFVKAQNSLQDLVAGHLKVATPMLLLTRDRERGRKGLRWPHLMHS